MLEDLEKECLDRKIPIVSKDKAVWLLNKIKEVKPKRVLELGTAVGYSGCILGSQGAELITIELNPKAAEEAMINFGKYNVNGRILIGDAVEIVKELTNKESETFDLIFIDHALKQYLQVLESCVILIKKNGIIIADNINQKVRRKDKVINCKDFKEAVLSHPKLRTEIILIKDGLSYSRKL